MIFGDWWETVQPWLLEWNKTGTLGDVLPWAITGLVAGLSALLGVITRKRQRSREQALQVSVWVENQDGTPPVVRVRNSSRGPIRNVLVLAAGNGLAAGDEGVQVASTRSIGPERSIDFPLHRDTNVHSIMTQVQFTDSSGRHWNIADHGELRRQGRPAPAPFIHDIVLAEKPAVQDHSATFTPKGDRLTLAAASVSRFDVDPNDGNNVTVILVTKGATVTAESVIELTRNEPPQSLVRFHLDGNDHIIKLTLCNLPSDTRDYLNMQEMGDANYHFMYFGKKDEPLEDILDVDRLNSSFYCGGKHLPIDLGVYVAFDESGHLLCLMLPRDRLMPGFLQYS